MFLILPNVSSYFDSKGLNRIVSISSKISSIFSHPFKARVLSPVSPSYYKGTEQSLYPQRCTRAPSVTLRVPPSSRRKAFVSSIITQIGREKTSSLPTFYASYFSVKSITPICRRYFLVVYQFVQVSKSQNKLRYGGNFRWMLPAYAFFSYS